jgi:hypothetical protein
MIRSRITLALALVAALSLVAPALGGARPSRAARPVPVQAGQQQDCEEFQCQDGTMGWCCGTVAERRGCLCGYCAEECF